MPSYGSYSDWLVALTSTRLGKLWLSKFRFDLRKGNLHDIIELKFVDTIEANLRSLEALPSALIGVDFILKKHSSSFDLKGQRIPKLFEPYSCVIKLEVFAHYYVKRRSLLTILDEGDEDINYIWDNLGLTITPRFYSGKVKTENDFFWCTPTGEIEKIQASYPPDSAATTLRTRLGLHLIMEGQKLIRIDIPPDALSGKRVVAPTAFDGGINPVFVPCDDSDGYGRTLNLSDNTRDLKELVSEAIDFTSRFKVQKIGIVNLDVPPINLLAIEALI